MNHLKHGVPTQSTMPSALPAIGAAMAAPHAGGTPKAAMPR